MPEIQGPASFKAGAPAIYYGLAVVGLPGLKRVEYWLRPDTGANGKLADDDPAWQSAAWQPCVIDPPPDDWTGHLPAGISPKEIWGFDPQTGKPKDWPLRYSVATWTMTLKDMKPGAYELRVRTVDMNGVRPAATPSPAQHRAQCHPLQAHQGDGLIDSRRGIATRVGHDWSSQAPQRLFSSLIRQQSRVRWDCDGQQNQRNPDDLFAVNRDGGCGGSDHSTGRCRLGGADLSLRRNDDVNLILVDVDPESCGPTGSSQDS